MNCENHPDREAVANCAVCGKAICEECLIKIAGNTYCKDCINELVTESIVEKAMGNKNPEPSIGIGEVERKPASQSEISTGEVEPELEDEAAEDGDYDFENQFEEENEEVSVSNGAGKHKFRSAAKISSMLEEKGLTEESASYLNEEKDEPVSDDVYKVPEPGMKEPAVFEESEVVSEGDGPDEELEAKYEKYLEDLYYDEPDKSEESISEEVKSDKPLSLQDQLAMDEAENGPLTRKPFIKKEEPEDDDDDEEEVEVAETVTSSIEDSFNDGTYTSSLSESDDEDVIVPVHMQNNNDGDDGLSYEEIRERILEEEGHLNSEPDTGRVQSAYANQQSDYEDEMREADAFNTSSSTGGYDKGLFHHSGEVLNNLPEDDVVEPQQYYEDEADYYVHNEELNSNVRSIHNHHESDDGEDEGKFSVGEIILTIILIVLILIVVSYVIYLFTLSGDYPTYIDAVSVLFSDPLQLIGNIFN